MTMDFREKRLYSSYTQRLTEVAVAFVERVPGSDLEVDEAIAHCRGKVASFKVPRHVVIVETLPMAASGKIRKVDLCETIRRRFAPWAGIQKSVPTGRVRMD